MNTRRTATAVGITAGGAMAAAFFSVGIAAADDDTPVSDVEPSGNAVIVPETTDGGVSPAYILDPGAEGPDLDQTVMIPGLVTVGNASDVNLDVYGPGEDGGTDVLGSVNADETVTDVFGILTTNYTIDGGQSAITGPAIEAALGDNFYGGDPSDLLGQIDGEAGDLSGDQLATIVNGGVVGDDITADSVLGDAVNGDQATNIAEAINDYGFVDSDNVGDALSSLDLGENQDAVAGALADALQGGSSDQASLLSDLVSGEISSDQVSDILSNADVELGDDVSAGDIAGALNDHTFFSTDTVQAALSDYEDNIAGELASNLNSDDLLSGDIDASDVTAALGDDVTLGDTGAQAIADALNDGDFSGGEGLPVDGTSISVTDLGFLGSNIYIEDADGAAQDFFTGPFGNTFDVSWLFGLSDAGTDVGNEGGTETAASLFDFLG